MSSLERAFQYACRLRGPVGQMNAPDWSVDWSDAPWPFKRYEGGRPVPLPAVAPLWARGSDGDDLARVGRLLQLSAGCWRIRVRPDGMVNSAPERPVALNRSATLAARRAVASGGGLYPAEVYLWAGQLDGLPPALYHYDPARHELRALSAAPPPLPSPPRLALAVTDHFWKSFFKYGDFAYRLSAVDLGIVVGRLERLVRALFGEATCHFDFDDRRWNEALHLDGAGESVYAVITGGAASPGPRPEPPPVPRHRQRSRTVKRSAAFDEVHASVLEGCPGRAGPPALPVLTGPLLPLPAPGRLEDLDRAIARRTSNGELFTVAGPGPDAAALATVLAEAARSLARLGGGAEALLHVVVQRVRGIPPGAYRLEEGGLRLVREGHLGLALQACSNVKNINVDLAAFTVHVVDRLDFRTDRRGVRAYRIQQMLAGAALDAVMLAAADLGLGSHPMLGFDAAALDALHDLTGGPLGVLAQVCVGPVRPGYHLEGSTAP